MAPGRPVRRLFDLEVDEISLVDRAANQHARVAIAKRGDQEEETPMPEIYDAEGVEVFEDELGHGDVVYGADGQEYVFLEDDGDDDGGQYEDDSGDYEAEHAEDGELAGVGKSSLRNKALARYSRARRGARGRADELKGRAGEANRGFREGLRGGHALSWTGQDFRRGNRVGAHLYGNRGRYALGAGGAGAAGGGAAAYSGSRREETSKSLGNSVLEDLSKALDQGERDQVIGKAMEYVQEADARAAEAWEVAKSLEEERDLERYVEAAGGYNLPVDPTELGSIMKRAAATLPAEDVETLDRIFTGVGEQLYDEIGYNGSTSESGVMDQVNSLALETVGKSDLSQAEAVVAMFEHNPQAYDEYMAETRLR